MRIFGSKLPPVRRRLTNSLYGHSPGKRSLIKLYPYGVELVQDRGTTVSGEERMKFFPASQFWPTYLAIAILTLSSSSGGALAASDTPDAKKAETTAKTDASDKAGKSDNTDNGANAVTSADKTNKSDTSENANKTDESTKKDKGKGEKPKGDVKSEPKAEAGAAGGVTAEKIAKVVGEQGEVGGEYKVTAEINGPEVIIRTWADVKAPAQIKDRVNDHKIDAVLITKKIIDAFPSANFARCRVVYFDRKEQTKFVEVYVSTEVVTAFATGALGKNALLDTLPYSIGDTNPAVATTAATTMVTPPVQPVTKIIGAQITKVGPSPMLLAKRQECFDRIKKLEKNGMKMTEERNLLALAEEGAAANDDERTRTPLVALLSSLNQKDPQNLKIAKVGSTGSSAGGNDKVYLPKGVDPNDGNAKHYLEMRAIFGEFWPHWGPCHPDRKNIALRLMDLQKKAPQIQSRIQQIKQVQRSGKAVDLSTDDLLILKQEGLLTQLPQLISQFQRMETLVANNGSAGQVEVAVKQMNQSMGLKELPRDAKYQMAETQAKEWRENGYK